MPQLLQKVLVGVLQTFLAPLLVWLVDKHILTSTETGQLVAEVAIYGGTALWAGIVWIRAHRQQLTALVMPAGSTVAQLADKIKAGETPSVQTPDDARPVVTKVAPLVLLVCVLGATLAGCGRPTVQVTPTPQLPQAILTQADTDIYARGNKSLGILEATGNLVVKVVQAEKPLQPVLPPGWHANFQTTVTRLSTAALAAIDDIEKGVVKDWPALRAKVQPIVDASTALLTLVQQLSPATSSRFGFSTFVQTIGELVGNLLTLNISRAPVPAGVSTW